jgi:hypothetical protein
MIVERLATYCALPGAFALMTMRKYDEAAIPIGRHVNQVGASPERALVASGRVDGESGLRNEKQDEARQGENVGASCYRNILGWSLYRAVTHHSPMDTSYALGLKAEIHERRAASPW